VSEVELFEAVAELSYLGDVRMGIAENPNKIRNIVNSGQNLAHFRALYRVSPLLLSSYLVMLLFCLSCLSDALSR